MTVGSWCKACLVRSALILVPLDSSIHIRPPPAPQQKLSRRLLSISSGDDPVAFSYDGSGLLIHIVVPSQIARIVKDYTFMLEALSRLKLTFFQQCAYEFRVVYHLELRAEVSVIMFEGAIAVGTQGQHFLDAVLFEERDIAAGKLVEHILVAEPCAAGLRSSAPLCPGSRMRWMPCGAIQ